MIERAVEHMGAERAGRYLRKFYPWYVERLGGTQGAAGRGAAGAVARSGAGAARVTAMRTGDGYLGRRAGDGFRRRGSEETPAPRRLYSPAHASRTRGPLPPERAGFLSSKRLHSQVLYACPRTSSSPQKVSPISRPSLSSCRPRAAARSPRGSRRLANSATSPRTPNTTTPRTSRRCSRRGSRSWRSSCARRP